MVKVPLFTSTAQTKQPLLLPFHIYCTGSPSGLRSLPGPSRRGTHRACAARPGSSRSRSRSFYTWVRDAPPARRPAPLAGPAPRRDRTHAPLADRFFLWVKLAVAVAIAAAGFERRARPLFNLAGSNRIASTRNGGEARPFLFPPFSNPGLFYRIIQRKQPP